MKQALTIAGSDSSGGAGIQADLKTFHAHGVFGASVITAVTAQNTEAVRGAIDLPCDFIEAQLEAVCDDLDISAVKTGMLSSPEIVETVAGFLSDRPIANLVVDPVMISKSGFKLLRDDAVDAIKRRLLPLARVTTPNRHEAELLAGMAITSAADLESAARRIMDLGGEAVIIKGGHVDFDPATDVLFDGRQFHRFPGRMIDTVSLHGTGCTYSAAIAARLARGEPLLEAVAGAKRYITRAIESAQAIGHGHGPTHHFYFLDGTEADDA